MATVFLAEDERLGRRVAVKRLHAESPEDMARRIEREAKLGASLNHPNLVGVYDTDTDEEGVLIVMEYVDGETLAQALRRGRLEVPRALEVVGGVAAGLDQAHGQGVVHRDVKPANVLLGKGGAVKLTDLGIARATEGTRITATGIVLGTPSYMAPEQLEGRAVGPAADVYSLAAVAFEALSGRKAREGKPLELAHKAATEPAPDLRRAWAEAPVEAAEVLARGMAPDPSERPASAGQLASELTAALGGSAAPAAPRRAPLASEAPVAAEPAPSRGRAAADAPRAAEPRPARVSSPGRSPTRAGAGARSATRWLIPLAVAILLLLGGGAALLASSGSDSRDRERSAGQRSEEGQPGPSAPAADETPPAAQDADEPSSAAPVGDVPAAVGGLSPEDTVRSFYERAAADDIDGAVALTGEGVQRQLGGAQGIAGTFATLESIEFTRAETVEATADAATVEFATVATHNDYVDHCSGTAALARGASGWLVERLSVPPCRREPR